MISIKDNDSLASRLAVEIGADLMIVMSDVDGVYDAPPGVEGSKLLSTYNPQQMGTDNIKFGEKSSVGTGGMDSKVRIPFFPSWLFFHFLRDEIETNERGHSTPSIL